MISAKEKAKELIEKFELLVTTWDCYWDTPRDEILILEDCKKCALICVDEIIIEINDYDIEKETLENSNIYWQNVRTEISNL